MNIEVCAVIVTYNPDIDLLKRQIGSLVNQCKVIVVDNSEDSESQNNVFKISERFETTNIVMGSNFGIAAAQNAGVKLAQKKFLDVRYILLLDQDSIPSDHFVDVLYSEYRRINKTEKIAVLGPALYDPRAKQFHGFHVLKGLRYRRLKPAKSEPSPIECTTVNSSGSFFSVDIFRDVGEFENNLFIDHVETEWSFRAKNLGYKLYATVKVSLEHYMGDEVLTFSLLGMRDVFLPYRSPLRHHYLFRNSLVLLRRPYIPIVWKLYCLIKLLFTFAIFLTFSNERRAQLKGMLRGVRDGLLGRHGKIKKID